MHSTTLASTLISVLSFTSLSTASVRHYDGWTLNWYDDFVGANGALPNGDRWIVDTGTRYPNGPAGWGNNEVETYTTNSRNIKQSGVGGLWITPIRERPGVWTSGRLESRPANFMAPAGRKMRIEAVIQMPNTAGQGVGYWAGFYTLGQSFRGNYRNWPSVAEHDIMENANGLNQLWGGMHCGTNPGGVCNEPVGLTTTAHCVGSACQGQWHAYTVVIDRSVQPEEARYMVDGQVYKTVTSAQVGADAWARAAHTGHFIVLDVAMGGNFPDAVAGYKTPTTSTVSGREMRVDYVAVYYS